MTSGGANHQAVMMGRRRVIHARIGLTAFVAATALCLFVSLTDDPIPPAPRPPQATSDQDVFRRVATRVQNGEAFHDADHDELRSHGYATRSVFNWRTPIYAWWIGRAIGETPGRFVLMAGVTAAVAFLSADLVRDCGLFAGLIGGFFLAGSMAWSVWRDAVVFTEPWAGMLIAISVAACRRRWTAVGVSAGLFALFYRELALPYVVVSMMVAAWCGRRREAVAWAVGLALFGVFLSWHAGEVHARLTAADEGTPGGWMYFGGLRFVLSTAQMNVFLIVAPFWCTALYVPVAAVGLAAMPGEWGRRVALSCGSFLAAFLVVGNPFNFYWGFVYGPLLALGLAYAPAAFFSLIGDAFGPSTRFRVDLA